MNEDTLKPLIDAMWTDCQANLKACRLDFENGELTILFTLTVNWSRKTSEAMLNGLALAALKRDANSERQ